MPGSATTTASRTYKPAVRPRLAFLGTGWIGLARLKAVTRSGLAEIVAVADPSPAALKLATDIVPEAATADSLEGLLDSAPDGLVIATPSALHARQSVAALERGIAVFCQKPLARTVAETGRVLEAARAADRLLAIDLCYREVRGVHRMRELVQDGSLGIVFAADLVFHNAYGPDKPWFYDPSLSGGGCLIDLGTHLVDLALWVLGFPKVKRATGTLFAKGLPVADPTIQIEDYAAAQLELETGALVRLTCSWNLSVGRDAVISASFHGTEGTAALRNIDGSFYDFAAELLRGTRTETLASGSDSWGERAIVGWAEQLGKRPTYDPQADHLLDVARILDAIYDR